MAYNHGKADRKWQLWKETEEKTLRACSVEEDIIKLLRTYDRAEFNSDRRFYRRLNDIGEYIEETVAQEQPLEVDTVVDMLDEIENERLYQALLTVDERTLQIILLKMQGYSTKEISSLVGLTAGAIYARLDHLRKKLRNLKL
ncbi:MAG: sigma factor-like helix-turn-helix DNA-binding protein [Lachnospiraceae bacterium]|nr:sigma factor-like helix-turn-helix DNA-binding protein [Lachnospiraceae bacterium]